MTPPPLSVTPSGAGPKANKVLSMKAACFLDRSFVRIAASVTEDTDLAVPVDEMNVRFGPVTHVS